MTTTWLVPGLIAANVLSTALSVIAFKLSGAAPDARGFLWYQIVGNAAGFVSVIAFTFTTRYLPLKIACPVTVALAILLVQLVVARVYFREAVSAAQALGGLLIAAGVVLVANKG